MPFFSEGDKVINRKGFLIDLAKVIRWIEEISVRYNK
jgi:hypothetical protein